jgi:cytochrome c553
MLISAIRIAGLAATLLLAGNAEADESNYIDLRRIEPVHGDVAAGASKAAVCHACHGVGAPVAPTFPRLAGQRADYLYHRLVSVKFAAWERMGDDE